MTVLAQILWPLVVLAYGVLVFFGVRLWLVSKERTVSRLEALVSELEKDWEHKFATQDEKYDRRLGAIERAVNSLGQREGKNPLGSHYDTRRPG